MTKQEILKIFNCYKGNITETEDTITITANNELVDMRNTYNEKNNCFDFKEKKCSVECVISYNLNRGYLDGYESTYSIIGGFGNPTPNKEDVESVLKKYNFIKKEVQQLDIFDFIN